MGGHSLPAVSCVPACLPTPEYPSKSVCASLPQNHKRDVSPPGKKIVCASPGLPTREKLSTACVLSSSQPRPRLVPGRGGDLPTPYQYAISTSLKVAGYSQKGARGGHPQNFCWVLIEPSPHCKDLNCSCWPQFPVDEPWGGVVLWSMLDQSSMWGLRKNRGTFSPNPRQFGRFMRGAFLPQRGCLLSQSWLWF